MKDSVQLFSNLFSFCNILHIVSSYAFPPRPTTDPLADPDTLSTMTVSSDEESDSIVHINSEREPTKVTTSNSPKPNGPTVDQLKIKTEASGMDAEAIENALEAHTDGLLQTAKAKMDLHSSGLSFTEISRRVRQIAAKKGKFEFYDFEKMNVEDENFDFSIFSNPDFKPDYITPAKATMLPEHIIEMRMIKPDPGAAPKDESANGNPPPIDRWWRDDEASNDPRKLSKTFVDTSAEESTLVEQDKNPLVSTKTFTHFLMKPDRRSALILELSKLHPDGAIIFHETPKELEEKDRRIKFIQKIRRTLNDSNPEGLVHLDEMLDMISENPKNFFEVKELIDTLIQQGITDPALIVDRIAFDTVLNKPVITPPREQAEAEMDHPDPKIRAMLNSFDTLHADHNRVDNPFLDNPNNGSISANDGSKSGLSAMRTPIMEKGRSGTDPSTGPKFSSTPRTSGTSRPTFFSGPPPKRARNFSMENFLDTNDNTPIKPEEYLRRHRVAASYLAKITDFPIQGRKTVGAWKNLARQKILVKPTPYEYHPRYSKMPGFLKGSFSGEALPGVFRPCSSGMSESQAMQAYRDARLEEPSCLMDLNAWVKSTYPPIQVEFNPDKHCIELEAYGLDFWSEVSDYDLSRTGASLSTNGIVPHCPMDRVTTDQFFKLYNEFIEPLAPFVADTLLTTLGPSFSTRKDFMWWSIPVPKYKGDLVLKDALFDHNGMSYLINNSSQVGRCAICRGLLVTPHHVTFLSYFYPDGLDPSMVNSSILQSWAAQRIAVCYVHALTDAVEKPGRKLQ